MFNEAPGVTNSSVKRYAPNKKCALNYHVRLTIFINGSDHAKYTRKSQLREDKSKCHKDNKGSCGRK